MKFTVTKYKYDNSFELDRGLTDLIKFLSCMLIALHHYSQYAIGIETLNNRVYYLLAWQGGYIGVALFFFLSGYGLMKSERANHLSLKDFFTRRICRVYLPVVVVSLLWLPIYSWMESDYSYGNLLMCAMGGGKSPFLDTAMWFVRVLLLLYASFFIYSKIRQLSKPLALIIFVISTIAVYYLVHSDYPPKAVSIPFFSLGVLIVEFPKIGRFFSNVIAILFLALMAAVLIVILINNHLAVHVIINWLVIVLFLFLTSRFRFVVEMAPKWVGDSSYDVYLVHFKVKEVLMTLMPTVHLWVFILVTVICTFCFHRFRKLLHI